MPATPGVAIISKSWRYRMIEPKHQKLKRGEFQFLYYNSIALLLLCATMLISPSINNSSHAEDNITIPLSTEIGIKSQTTISLALASQINLEVIPKSTGATSFSSTQLSISTNSNDGYSLYLQAGDNGARSDGSLIPVTNTIDSKIINTTKQNAPLFDANNHDNGIGSNSYGYALSKDAITTNTLYSHIPTSADPSKVVLSVDSATATTGDYPYGDTYNLAFGTNIDTSLPAGQYSGTVTVSAVANPKTLTSLYDITYMQDMNPTICENTRSGYTKQLVDNRDGNSYWVAKLADENCWMTQNLALDLSTGVTLTPEDSDVNANWTPNNNTETAIPEKASVDNTSARSWNLGKIILTNPTRSELCSATLPDDLKDQDYTEDTDINYNSVWYNHGSLTENCPEYYKNVENITAEYNATETSSISPDLQSYDAHYLIGNYYTWNAATADSGTETNTTNKGNAAAATDPNKLVDATSSICPKGWKLPVSGRYNSNGIIYPFEREDSFLKLLMAYGYPAGNATAGWIAGSGGSNSLYPLDSEKTTRPDYSPMYFVRNGLINYSRGSLRRAGLTSYIWSSTALASSTASAYYLTMNNINISPSGYDTRYNGFSIRCIAR